MTKTGAGSIENTRVIAQKQEGLYAVVYHPIGGVLPTGKPAELAALLQGIWRRAKGRPLFKAGSLDAWLRRKGGPVSVFYVFCALALAGALAALRTAQL